MTDARDLEGVGVLITRPVEQSRNLERLVTRHGGNASLLPLIDIQPVAPDPDLERLLRAALNYEIVIFISRNAVEHGLRMLRAAGGEIAPDASIAAIGESTAKALQASGFADVVYPKAKSNSEELLECELLKEVSERRVIIFRGQGGRELLAETLRARGALVDYAEVYRRVEAATDVEPILRSWLESRCPVMVLTSESSARALLGTLPAALADRVLGAPLAVVSERLRNFCSDAGWRGPIGVCASAGDEALIFTVREISNEHDQTSST